VLQRGRCPVEIVTVEPCEIVSIQALLLRAAEGRHVVADVSSATMQLLELEPEARSQRDISALVHVRVFSGFWRVTVCLVECHLLVVSTNTASLLQRMQHSATKGSCNAVEHVIIGSELHWPDHNFSLVSSLTSCWGRTRKSLMTSSVSCHGHFAV
jgi:hypothetical protein